MSRQLAIIVAASCTINMALVVLGRGGGGQFIIVFLIFGFALFAACIGSFARLLVRLGWGAPGLRRWATRAIVLGIVAGSSLASVPIGILVNRYDVAQAKNFCNRLKPALERYKRATGRYPESVSEVSKVPLPRLLQEDRFYDARVDGYSFMFMNPLGMLDGFEFDSRSGVWREFD